MVLLPFGCEEGWSAITSQKQLRRWYLLLLIVNDYPKKPDQLGVKE